MHDYNDLYDGFAPAASQVAGAFAKQWQLSDGARADLVSLMRRDRDSIDAWASRYDVDVVADELRAWARVFRRMASERDADGLPGERDGLETAAWHLDFEARSRGGEGL